MDGSDELAAPVRESSGGVCVAGRIFGATHVRYTEIQAEENGSGDSGSSRRGETDRGGAGAYLLLSGNQMTAQVWIAVLVGLAATIDDLARRQIANWIPAAALVGGFGWHIGQNGWRGAWYALAGAVAGFAVFLIFYLLGGMGGGDVKLMAGFGALLGAHKVLEAALWTAGCGGLLAALVIAVNTLRGVWRSHRLESSQSGATLRSLRTA